MTSAMERQDKSWQQSSVSPKVWMGKAKHGRKQGNRKKRQVGHSSSTFPSLHIPMNASPYIKKNMKIIHPQMTSTTFCLALKILSTAVQFSAYSQPVTWSCSGVVQLTASHNQRETLGLCLPDRPRDMRLDQDLLVLKNLFPPCSQLPARMALQTQEGSSETNFVPQHKASATARKAFPP